MGPATSPFIEELVDAEVRRLVAETIANGNTISTAECVAKVKDVYPTCGLSRNDIVGGEVMMAAAAAGVAVEIGLISRQRDNAERPW